MPESIIIFSPVMNLVVEAGQEFLMDRFSWNRIGLLLLKSIPSAPGKSGVSLSRYT